MSCARQREAIGRKRKTDSRSLRALAHLNNGMGCDCCAHSSRAAAPRPRHDPSANYLSVLFICSSVLPDLHCRGARRQSVCLCALHAASVSIKHNSPQIVLPKCTCSAEHQIWPKPRSRWLRSMLMCCVLCMRVPCMIYSDIFSFGAVHDTI